MKGKLWRKMSRLGRRLDWGGRRFSFVRDWAGSEPAKKVVASAAVLAAVVLIQRTDFAVAQKIEDGIRYVIRAEFDYAPVLQRLETWGGPGGKFPWPVFSPRADPVLPESAGSASFEAAAVEARALQRGMALPLQGDVTSAFGAGPDPLEETEQQHSGVDIAAPLGTPILAALEGIVAATGEDEAYGKTVAIQHGDGIETVYAHCASVSVQAGQFVAQSEEIATVGATGKASGPHLHFEIRVDGAAIDPARVMELP